MDRLDTILGGIEEERLLDLLVDAVDAYSPCYAEESATRVFTSALGRAGLSCRLEPVPATLGDRSRANLIRRGLFVQGRPR